MKKKPKNCEWSSVFRGDYNVIKIYFNPINQSKNIRYHTLPNQKKKKQMLVENYLDKNM